MQIVILPFSNPLVSLIRAMQKRFPIAVIEIPWAIADCIAGWVVADLCHNSIIETPDVIETLAFDGGIGMLAG